MKKLIITLAALTVSIAAYGQGQFNFNNRIPPGIDARFVLSSDAAGTSSIGTPDWSIQLLGGPVGGALVALSPATVAFRGAAGTSAAGYTATGISPIVPNVDVGGTAAIVVRVLGPGGISQDFNYTTPLGGGTVIPPNLQMGTSPLVINAIPEPATLALGALGVGALLMMRRRK